MVVGWVHKPAGIIAERDCGRGKMVVTTFRLLEDAPGADPVATALLDGRTFVTPDDVKTLAPAVLRHRVVVAPELELEGVSADAALAAMIDRVEVPRS